MCDLNWFHNLRMIKFDRVKLDSKTEVLREEVRQFLDDNSEHLETRNSDFVTGHDPVFSKKLGDKGWIGMTWPGD